MLEQTNEESRLKNVKLERSLKKSNDDQLKSDKYCDKLERRLEYMTQNKTDVANEYWTQRTRNMLK